VTRRLASPRIRHALRALGALVTATVLLLPAAPVRAADITFGTPASSSTYGQSMEFTVPITSGTAPERVELRLIFPGAIGPYIVAIDPPAAGSVMLHHVMDMTGSGYMAPNTPLTATWAAFATVGAAPVLSESLTVLYADTGHAWRTVKGDLVRVHWYEGSETFARRALGIAEDAVRQASALLGVTETEPIDFFIYGDQPSFRTAIGPGARENVGGTSRAEIRTLFTYLTADMINDPWVGIVIPHELVHLVFDTAVSNPYRYPPRWFNEGLAVYLSEGYGPADRNRMDAAVAAGDLLPLTALTGQFPTDPDKTYLAYAESVSAIDYLVRTDGSESLYALVDAYGGGLTDDEAFTKALGRDVAAFQAGWLKDLGGELPVQYGPQPAPAGPLPTDWTGPAQTPGPGSTTGAQTPAPPTAAATVAPGDPGRPAGGVDTAPVLAAIAAVVVVVVILLVVARRRAGPA
jgi:hypothetical protein